MNGSIAALGDAFGLWEFLISAAPFVTRILGLANFALDIVEAVRNDCEPEGISLSRLVKGFPGDWGGAENGNLFFS